MAVVLMNPFELPAEVADEEFLAGWQRAADYMARQPGFIRSRLHRALRDDARFRFVNVAEWESPSHFQAAVSTDEFRTIAGEGPAGAPSLYQVVKEI